MSDSSREWVVVATTEHAEEAIAWRDLLGGTGLEIDIEPDVDHVELFTGTAGASLFELMVPKEQEVQARQELKEIQMNKE